MKNSMIHLSTRDQTRFDEALTETLVIRRIEELTLTREGELPIPKEIWVDVEDLFQQWQKSLQEREDSD